MSVGIMPALAGTNIDMSAQQLRAAMVTSADTGDIDTLGCIVSVAGSGPGTGVNRMAIYDAEGDLLGQTGDMTSAFQATGSVEGFLASEVPVTAGENYYIVAVCNFASSPSLYGDSGAIADIAGFRTAGFNTSVTSIPSTLHINNPANVVPVMWARLSGGEHDGGGEPPVFNLLGSLNSANDIPTVHGDPGDAFYINGDIWVLSNNFLSEDQSSFVTSTGNWASTGGMSGVSRTTTGYYRPPGGLQAISAGVGTIGLFGSAFDPVTQGFAIASSDVVNLRARMRCDSGPQLGGPGINIYQANGDASGASPYWRNQTIGSSWSLVGGNASVSPNGTLTRPRFTFAVAATYYLDDIFFGVWHNIGPQTVTPPPSWEPPIVEPELDPPVIVGHYNIRQNAATSATIAMQAGDLVVFMGMTGNAQTRYWTNPVSSGLAFMQQVNTTGPSATVSRAGMQIWSALVPSTASRTVSATPSASGNLSAEIYLIRGGALGAVVATGLISGANISNQGTINVADRNSRILWMVGNWNDQVTPGSVGFDAVEDTRNSFSGSPGVWASQVTAAAGNTTWGLTPYNAGVAGSEYTGAAIEIISDESSASTLIPYLRNTWQNEGFGYWSQSVSPATVGSMLVVSISHLTTGTTTPPSAVSGGGVTTWTRATYRTGSWSQCVDIWYGQVISAGSGTVTVTPASALASQWSRIRVDEFAVDESGLDWSMIASSPVATTSNETSGTNMTMPALTGSGLYVGNAAAYSGTATLASPAPAGFTLVRNGQNQIVAINPDATDPAPGQVGTLASAVAWTSCAALFTVSAGGSGPTITVPGAPTGVSATAGNANASVTWTAPANNGGTPITGYTVVGNPGGSASTTGAVSATVSGLTNGTPYTFTVRAVNSVGTSASSSSSTPVTPTAGGVQPGSEWTAFGPLAFRPMWVSFLYREIMPSGTWTLQSGSLPPGISLVQSNANHTPGVTNGTWLLEGTPTTAGTYNFTLRMGGVDYPRSQTVYALPAVARVSDYESGAPSPRGDRDDNWPASNAGITWPRLGLIPGATNPQSGRHQPFWNRNNWGMGYRAGPPPTVLWPGSTNVATLYDGRPMQHWKQVHNINSGANMGVKLFAATGLFEPQCNWWNLNYLVIGWDETMDKMNGAVGPEFSGNSTWDNWVNPAASAGAPITPFGHRVDEIMITIDFAGSYGWNASPQGTVSFPAHDVVIPGQGTISCEAARWGLSCWVTDPGNNVGALCFSRMGPSGSGVMQWPRGHVDYLQMMHWMYDNGWIGHTILRGLSFGFEIGGTSGIDRSVYVNDLWWYGG